MYALYDTLVLKVVQHTRLVALVMCVVIVKGGKHEWQVYVYLGSWQAMLAFAVCILCMTSDLMMVIFSD